jgi:hypothetical protein
LREAGLFTGKFEFRFVPIAVPAKVRDEEGLDVCSQLGC